MPITPDPSNSPAAVSLKKTDVVEFEYTFRFITPMFGGGVESEGPQKPFDPQTPIRIPSIRGQLRFWWRACNPTKVASISELRKAEEQVWGSTEIPSRVTIRLAQPASKPQVLEVFTKDHRLKPEHKSLAYGIFPLKPPTGSRAEPGVLWRFHKNDTFTLIIRCQKDSHPGVKEALQAWSLFGGLGGRTRRGFGAIESATKRPWQDPKQFLRDLVKRPQIPEVPSLCGAEIRFAKDKHDKSDIAWASALSKLQRFRQGKGLGRNPGTQKNRPGRSRWPEPEQIRQLSGARAPKHRKLAPHISKFPRAVFGLPIIFHFHPGAPNDPGSQGDPKDSTLTPKDLTRFASPLVLRPVRDESGGYRPMALRLASTLPPTTLTLSGESQNSKKFDVPVKWELSPTEASVIQPLDHCTDPLKAFLTLFSK